MFPRALSRVNNLRLVSRPREHLRIRQRIVNDYVRILDVFLRSQRHEPKVSRPRADQIEFPILALTHALALTRLVNSAAKGSPSSQSPCTSAARGGAQSSPKNCALIFILPFSIFANTPTGALQ